MQNKIILIVGLILITAAAVALAFGGARWLSSLGNEETTEIPAASIPAVTLAPSAAKSGGDVASQRKQIEAQNPDGPWSHDLMVATSVDGTAFSGSKTFVEHAGVPSVTYDAQGQLVAVFQWFPDDDAAWDKVAVVFSDDEGKTWTEPLSIVMKGLPEGYQRPFDPTVTLAKDGMLHLFFTSSADKQGPNQMTQIYAATSNDGVTYDFKGLSLTIDGHRLFDCAALLFGDMWHLTTPLTPDLGAYHAVSTDGIAFTRTDDIEVPGWNWGGNLVGLGDSSMRFYGTESMHRGIWWSESTDGKTWSDPTPTGLSGADPGIVKLENGTYLIIYVK
ncbi:hypothetical protein A2501_02875 [Candidatus Uhrbacteria bacterium RIFOXYC12_FULL_57_11]|nr:MAG: hypothetical protein A2501_02875 [Candidatus Uhrbacteria bacterium RIFOXYC12_FULL_57_11]